MVTIPKGASGEVVPATADQACEGRTKGMHVGGLFPHAVCLGTLLTALELLF